MIRTNLSTRPFYNERAVQLVLLAAGLVVLAATPFNVMNILQLSRQDTQPATQAANDAVRARDLPVPAARPPPRPARTATPGRKSSSAATGG